MTKQLQPGDETASFAAAIKLARHLVARSPLGADEDAANDAAVDGYLRAARTFDPSRGTWRGRLTACVRDAVWDTARRSRRGWGALTRVDLDGAAESLAAVDRRPLPFDVLHGLRAGVVRRVAEECLVNGRAIGEAATVLRMPERTVLRHKAAARRRLAVAYAG